MTPRADMDLDAWVAMLDAIYSPTKNYERTEYQLYERLVEQFAGIAKYAAKRPDRNLLGESLARSFSWLVAVCIKTGNPDLGELVWHKFPGACAYCGQEKCQCGREKSSPIEDRLESLRKFNRSQFPKNLRGWQEMFANIYFDKNAAELKERLDMVLGGPTLFNPAPDDTLYRLRMLISLFHLVEELGEMGRALRHRYFSINALRDEIADIFAWTMGAANMIAMHPDAVDFCFQDVLWQCYPGVCGLCKVCPCRCAAAPNEDLLEIANQGCSLNSDALTSVGSQAAWLRMLSVADGDHVARKRASPLALMVLDVNDFKLINERQGGHLQGDQVLAEIGVVLRSVGGEKHPVFRVGGDEFAVMLANCDESQASLAADKIRTAITSHSFADIKDSTRIEVTVSIGTACTADGALTFTQLYQLADEKQANDKQIYRSKTERQTPLAN